MIGKTRKTHKIEKKTVEKPIKFRKNRIFQAIREKI